MFLIIQSIYDRMMNQLRQCAPTTAQHKASQGISGGRANAPAPFVDALFPAPVCMPGLAPLQGSDLAMSFVWRSIFLLLLRSVPHAHIHVAPATRNGETDNLKIAPLANF
jgi:hypothetical protein